MRGDEVVNVRDERLAHRVHQCGRGVQVAAVTSEKSRHPAAVGQARLPDIEIHPVDALHLERHMIGKDIGHSAG
jgi:hypothetical protein